MRSFPRQGFWLPVCPLLALSAAAFAQLPAPRNPQEPKNLARNGGFENPAVPSGGVDDFVTAGAWTAEAGTIEIQHDAGGFAALEGDQYLALGSWAVVSQRCATRVGQRYSLSFAWSPRQNSGTCAFEVWYAGQLLETINVASGANQGWTHESYAVVGASANDEIELRVLKNSSTGVWIDDVFLMPYDPAFVQQIVRNGNFEDDPRLPANGQIENPVYIGWSSGFHYDILAHDLGTTGNGYDGKNVIHLREKRATFQRVYVVPQQPYQLSFAYSPNPSDDRARTFTVTFAGQLLETITVPTSPSIAWTVKSYTVTSPSPLAVLEFKDKSDGVVGTYLDAVKLTGIVPEEETAGQVSRFWAMQRGTVLPLAFEAMFARGMTNMGDLDGNGVQDLAIGSVGDDDGAENAGAVWIAFMNANFSVKATQKISELRGGLVADLQKDDGFGRALSSIGDLDGDGIMDLAVGANEDDTGAHNAGAVFVLFMRRDGTVRAQRKITAQSGDNLDYVPVFESNFGAALCGMGDVDGDGIPDMAVGSRYGDSVQVCFMRRDGSVRASKNITYGANGFTDTVTSVSDFFGMSCANMGDFDRDGVNDLLIGAFGRRIHFMNYVGGQYLMLLNRDGTVKRWFYYGYENLNSRTQTLGVNYNLGTACVGLGDVDGDGVRDLASCAQREGPISGLEREESTNTGAVYVLLLNADGTIKTSQRLGDRAGGFDMRINDGTRWGESLCNLGDWDGNGLVDVAIGSRFAYGTGAVWRCELVGEVREPLRADFTGAPLTGQAPLAVTFTDRSTGGPVSWFWELGDGATSTQRNPSHSYAASGAYTVRLSVEGADGATHTKTATNYVNVSPSGGGGGDGIVKLGCGINPPTSFQILAGVPRIGTSMTFGVDNPFGTQRAGSIPIVVASWTASPRTPCGSSVANRGMSAPRTPGELLIGTPVAYNRQGPAWTGPGNPAPVTFAIPNNASFIGRTLYVQGRLKDGAAGATIPLSFADGFALTFRP